MFVDQGFNADRENLVDGKINVRRIGHGQCELHIMLSSYHQRIAFCRISCWPRGAVPVGMHEVAPQEFAS